MFAPNNSRNSRERKKEKNIAQLNSDCLRLNILFDCFSYEEMKNKMAANEEKLSIAVQKHPAKKHTSKNKVENVEKGKI